jgi:hypothetical protein
MLLNRNRSELHFSSSYERLICSEELGSCHQTPTLIGCIFLTNLQDLQASQLVFLAVSAAISEALDYDRFFEALSSCFCCSVCDSLLSSRLAVVISEALDSIPIFGSFVEPKALVSSAAALPLSRPRLQPSPRL